MNGSTRANRENVFAGCPTQRRTPRSAMCSCVSSPSATAPPDTRRRVLVSELTGAGARQVPEILERQRNDTAFSASTIDPVTERNRRDRHESLLTEWHRLADSIESSRVDVQAQRSLSSIASTWVEHDKAQTFLLSEGQLDEISPARSTPTGAPHRCRNLRVPRVECRCGRREPPGDVRRLRRLRRLVTVTGVALVVALVAQVGVALRSATTPSRQKTKRDASLKLEALEAAEAANEPQSKPCARPRSPPQRLRTRISPR